MRKFLQILLASTLALGLAVGVSVKPAAAWVDHYPYFKNSIIDTDGDFTFDLSICFGDNTSQGVYKGRSYLLEYLRNNMARVNLGDNDVNGRAYDRGFVSSGVCNNDGSSIHIHYYNFGGSNPIARADSGPIYSGLNLNMTECHIYLNTYYTYSWQQPTESTSLDGNSVVLHEMLHCWGLNHSNYGVDGADGQHETIMHSGHSMSQWPYVHHSRNVICSAYGDTQWITADDIAGARSIYDRIHYAFLVADLKPGSGIVPYPCTA